MTHPGGPIVFSAKQLKFIMQLQRGLRIIIKDTSTQDLNKNRPMGFAPTHPPMQVFTEKVKLKKSRLEKHKTVFGQFQLTTK